jgi:hypothetical protein
MMLDISRRLVGAVHFIERAGSNLREFLASILRPASRRIELRQPGLGTTSAIGASRAHCPWPS